MTIDKTAHHDPAMGCLPAEMDSEPVEIEAPAKPDRPMVDPNFALRGVYTNPLLDAANPLFGLSHYLYRNHNQIDVARLRKQVGTQVSTIMEEVRRLPYDEAQLLAYSYTLCLYMDETVMSTRWGRDSCWSQASLLSEFHDDSWGGEKFFTLLSRMQMEPEKYVDVLEFMHMCICLGLKGKYALQADGEAAVQKIIENLYEVIRGQRGDPPEYLTDPLTNVAPRNYRIKRQWPWWSPWVVAVVIMASAYSVYSWRLNNLTQEVLHSLDAILRL